jgi:hypothetical protein
LLTVDRVDPFRRWFGSSCLEARQFCPDFKTAQAVNLRLSAWFATVSGKLEPGSRRAHRRIDRLDGLALAVFRTGFDALPNGLDGFQVVGPDSRRSRHAIMPR